MTGVRAEKAALISIIQQFAVYTDSCSTVPGPSPGSAHIHRATQSHMRTTLLHFRSQTLLLIPLYISFLQMTVNNLCHIFCCCCSSECIRFVLLTSLGVVSEFSSKWFLTFAYWWVSVRRCSRLLIDNALISESLHLCVVFWKCSVKFILPIGIFLHLNRELILLVSKMNSLFFSFFFLLVHFLWFMFCSAEFEGFTKCPVQEADVIILTVEISYPGTRSQGLRTLCSTSVSAPFLTHIYYL